MSDEEEEKELLKIDAIDETVETKQE